MLGGSGTSGLSIVLLSSDLSALPGFKKLSSSNNLFKFTYSVGSAIIVFSKSSGGKIL